MSDVQNFIEIPNQPLDFRARARLSLQTTWRFIFDQKWASLVFLLVYLGLLYWEFHSSRLLPAAAKPDWTQNWPEFLAPLREQIARQSTGTWRSMLAALVMLLYWGNALLYIADRSEGFNDRPVVGLVRYILRGMVITLLMLAPIGIGLMLLVVPGLFLAGILIAAATITVFQPLGIFRAIAEAYRMVTRSLPGQSRILGFSRSFVHIVGAYGLVLLATGSFGLSFLLFAAVLTNLLPAATMPVNFLQMTSSNLLSAFLNLSFSIFVLQLYAEYLHGLADQTKSREESVP